MKNIILTFFIIFVAVFQITANVTLTPATGGGAISADDEGAGYTTLVGPVIEETANGEVGTGTIILNAPTGFIFDVGGTAPTLAMVRVGGSGGISRNINDIGDGNIALTTITTTQITFSISAASTNGVTCKLTGQNIRIRPSTGAVATGNLLTTGSTSTLAGVTHGTTNFGSLAVVAGAFAKMQVLVPGEAASPGLGSGKTGSPAAQTAGTTFNITVNSVDAHWNIVNSINTVAITSSDANAILPADAALVAGTKNFGVKLVTGGTGTVTASNVTTPAMTADISPSITVGAGVFSKLQILMPGESADPGSASGKTGSPTAQTAGSSFSVTVNAVDAYWNLITGETSTISITSSDINATLPVDAALVAGTNTYNVTFRTAGTATVTANDNPVVVTGGSSPSTTVNAGTFVKLQVIVPGETAAPGSATGKTGTATAQNVGSPFSVIVNAVDANWNKVNSTSTIDISSTDGTFTDPSNAALVAGTKSFGITFNSSGAYTVSASDVPDVVTDNTSSSINAVNSILSVATGGSSISADNTGGSYTTLTGPSFTEGVSGDVGVGTIVLNAPSGVLFDVGGTAPTLLMNRVAGAGADALNINGLADGSTIALTSISTTQIEFTIGTASSSGVACQLTFQDVRVRPNTGATETGKLTKTGTSVMSGVTNGVTSFGTMTVVAGVFTKMQLIVPGETAAPGTGSGKTGSPDPQTAGTSFNVIVNGVDAYWNVVNTTNTVGLTTTDANASLPANAGLIAGTKTMGIVMKTTGTPTITGTNISDGAKTADTSPSITVNAGAFVKLQILVPGESADPGSPTGKTGTPLSQTAGTPFSITVNAVDANFNIVSVTDVVGITASDIYVTLPSNAALVGGTNNYGVTFNNAGDATLTSANITDGTKTPGTTPLVTTDPGTFTKLQLLVPGETADPGSATGKTGTPDAQSQGVPFNVTVNAVDANWNLINTETSTIAITSSDAAATLPADAALVAGTKDLSVTFNAAPGTETITANDNPLSVTGITSPAITITLASHTDATGGGAISADDKAGPTYTALTGPVYTEGNTGDVGTGTIILEAPTGFIFNTGSAPDLLVTRITGAGGNSRNINGIGSGSAIALTSISTTQIEFTITSSSNTGVICSLTFQNVEVAPSTGEALSGDLTISGSASLPGISGTTNLGTLTVIPGAFTKMQALLPGETADPGSASGKTGTPTDQTAGTPFNVTVNGVDVYWNVVSSVTDVAGITSSDVNATLPANAALSSGTGVYSVTLNSQGAKTVTASDITDGGKTADTSPSITVNGGAFAKMQILLPGETADPGSASGKTGTPTAQTAGTPFNVTVNAVDANWNVVTDVVDVGGITSSDANALLPSDAALVAGTKNFSVTLKTGGTATISSSDISDGTKTLDTSPSVTINAGAFTKMQLLVPGETADPGSPTGKTGTPSGQTPTLAFTTTVNAVDDCWNIVSSTNTVGITSDDGTATLPSNTPLVGGTINFAITLNAAGDWTVTATNISDVTKTDDVSPSISTNPVAWTGGASTTNWGDAANWSPLGVPGVNTNVDLTGAVTIEIDVAATCYNLTLNNSSLSLSLLSGNSLTVSNDFTITDGTFITKEEFPAVTGTTSITGGTVEIAGSVAQTFTPASGTTFNNLKINNSNGVTLANPININGALTLTDGILLTDVTNILTMNTGSTSDEGSTTSFVDGPMNKAGTTAFVFPVGAGTRWARIGIGAPSSATTFQAQYVEATYANTTTMASSPTPVLNKVSTKEYWNLTRETGAGNAAVTLYWEDSDFSSIDNCTATDIRVAHWNSVTSEWENNNDAVTTSGSCVSGSGSVSTTAVVTDFSPFTFGSLNLTYNPLPIELLSFDAFFLGDEVELKWVTASEINNDFFTLEKTQDGINYEIVETISGAGNSTGVLNYSFVDSLPLKGVSYYRLKQTDFDGKFTYSELKMVQKTIGNDFSFEIYPNPNEGDFFSIQFNTNNTEEGVLVVVYDLLGNELFSKIIVTSENEMEVYAIDPSHQLDPGVYLIIASDENAIYKKRLIVN